ncbi:MAG: HEAT repeat domain-containing protein, partial [Planctomycetaceae bacterium]|nr:HEAT repeat domain-containing protein [Planctomycetaceae bacterium]
MPDSPAFDAVCTSLEVVLAGGVDVHRCLAAKALGRIRATTSVQSLVRALLDEDEDVRSDAAEALLNLADPESGQQLLENLLGDPCTEVKLSAIATLAKLGDQRVIPWLRRMVIGRDPEIAWDEEEFFSSGWDDWVEIQLAAIKALAELSAVEAIPDIVTAICHDDAQDMILVAFKSL